MKFGSIRMRLIAVSLSTLLVSCRTSQDLASSPNPLSLSGKNDSRLALVIKESVDGQVTYEWLRLDDLHLVQNKRHASAQGDGHVVLVSTHPRDCHAEYEDCINECMSRPLPRGYGHITRRGGLGGKEEYCNRRCIQPYRDCMDLQELKPQEFSTSDAAVDWLKDHYKELLIGSTVIIAGVVFVVVSGGAGLFVLAPALLLSDSGTPSDAQFMVASP